MEPPCEHGGVTRCRTLAMMQSMLQWSRRVNTAEWMRGRLPRGDDGVLQWSRRVNTAECSHPPPRRRRLRCFNGAAV